MMNHIDWPRYWQQLAVMIDAGLSIESALRALDKKASSGRTLNSPKHTSTMERVIGLVARGQSLSNAFKQARCISEIDYTVLNIAETAGKLPLGLHTISKRRNKWLSRINSLKAGLLLPKFLLLVGAFIGFFLRVSGHQQPLLSSLFSVLSILIVAWSLIAITVRLIQTDSLFWLSIVWPLSFVRRQWNAYILAFEDVFYKLLAWQIGAGISPDKALYACASLLSPMSFKKPTLSASKSTAGGKSVPDALLSNGLVLSESLKRVLLTSIETGNWDNAVLSHLKIQHRELSLKIDNFFKWLPRVYYLIALLAFSKFMIV